MSDRNIQGTGNGIRVNAGDIFPGIGVFAAGTVIGHIKAKQISGIFRHHIPAPDFGVRDVIRHSCRRREIDGRGDIIFRFGIKVAGFKFQSIIGQHQVIKTQPKTVLLSFVSFRT